MLLDYQNNNLRHLELALKNNDTVTIIGKPNSGRKTVVTNLNYENSIIINIFPHNDSYPDCSDFLLSIKNIDILTKDLYELIPEISLGDIFSFSIEKKELFNLEKHLIKNLKKASKKHKLILIVEKYEKLDIGTKNIINKIRSNDVKNKLKKGLISIFISDYNSADKQQIIGKDIYFEHLTYEQDKIRGVFSALNLNPNIDLSEEIMQFILKNADGNIKLISTIIDDINHNRIDKGLNLIDSNNNIKFLVNNRIDSQEFADKIRYILNIIAISDKYFTNLDLSFLLSEEVNIIDYYMSFAGENKYVTQINNCYQIIFGVIKKIFNTIPETQKIKIYNKIVKLINTYYPNQYKEKYHFASLAKDPKCNIYLLQSIFQEIRKKGKVYIEAFDLSKEEKHIVNQYFRIYSKASRNGYQEAIEALESYTMLFSLASPLKEEFMLLKSQILIKSINENSRREAIEALAYDDTDNNIDEYLKYRIETRKIAALIHNGDYKQAKMQSVKMENKFLSIISNTKSPGIEYYLNIIYRKYCNIHSYESSIVAINKSISFFSNNPNYIKETYIALNNALALNLINGSQEAGYKNMHMINMLKEEHFNLRFPRPEIYENNQLIFKLIYEEGSVDIADQFRILCKKTKGNADNVFIRSNYAIALALSGDIISGVDILKKMYDDPMIENDKEGVYKLRVYCNYAILLFLMNRDKENSLKILNEVNIPKDDLHYPERSKELNLIIKTINNSKGCSSAKEWMEQYQNNIHTIKNYNCLYEQGFVFTTLFDWDDE